MHRNRYENHIHFQNRDPNPFNHNPDRINPSNYPATEHFLRQERKPRPKSSYGAEHVNWDETDHRGHGPKNYVRTDERMKEDLSEALTHHPEIDASDVEIQIQDGVVTLSGTIPDRRMKRQTEDCAFTVTGVKDVKNQLTLQKISREPLYPKQGELR